MTSILRLVTAAWFLLAVGPAHAILDVFACEPEWGALVAEIAGARAKVYVATTAMQDVHRIQARPSLIARARTADLLICTGADLEIGWLPLVRNQSGNDRIQLGRPGSFEVAPLVPRIDVPATVDRALGDTHPMGNPHVQFGPAQIQRAATELARRLAAIDGAGDAEYKARLDDFTRRWGEATERWAKLGAPLKGVAVIQYHKNFNYLFAFLGMREVGSLEPKPGVEPSSSHLNTLASQQKTDPARLILRASYHSRAAADWLAERTGLPSLELPATVGGSPAAKDLFGLYDDTIQRMLAALKGRGG